MRGWDYTPPKATTGHAVLMLAGFCLALWILSDACYLAWLDFVRAMMAAAGSR